MAVSGLSCWLLSGDPPAAPPGDAVPTGAEVAPVPAAIVVADEAPEGLEEEPAEGPAVAGKINYSFQFSREYNNFAIVCLLEAAPLVVVADVSCEAVVEPAFSGSPAILRHESGTKLNFIRISCRYLTNKYYALLLIYLLGDKLTRLARERVWSRNQRLRAEVMEFEW